MFSKRHLVRIIYIACFAVLMAALAPAVSQVLAASDCHTKAVHPLNNHCGYCVMQGDLPFVPTVAIALPPPERPMSLVPQLFQLAPSPLFIWLAAQPRAPPAA